MVRRRVVLGGAGAVALAAAGRSATAAWAPRRTVRIIVPVPAGSVPDILARILAEHLAPIWSVPVVIDNRPGASGAIGVESAARSPGDGHTLLLGSSGPMAILPAVSRRLAYDPRHHFQPVARVGDFPLIFLASTQSGLMSFADVLARGRAAGDGLDYAGGDRGSTQHLAGALLALRAGLRLNHIPYRGGGLAQADLIAGRIPLMVDSLSAVLRTIRDGKAVPLAVCGARPAPQLAEVPTVAACGVPEYEATGWMGVFTPAETPPEVVAALSEAIVAAVRAPAMTARIIAVGSEPVAQESLAFGTFLDAELGKWKRLAEMAGIDLD